MGGREVPSGAWASGRRVKNWDWDGGHGLVPGASNPEGQNRSLSPENSEKIKAEEERGGGRGRESGRRVLQQQHRKSSGEEAGGGGRRRAEAGGGGKVFLTLCRAVSPEFLDSPALCP